MQVTAQQKCLLMFVHKNIEIKKSRPNHGATFPYKRIVDIIQPLLLQPLLPQQQELQQQVQPQ